MVDYLKATLLLALLSFNFAFAQTALRDPSFLARIQPDRVLVAPTFLPTNEAGLVVWHAAWKLSGTNDNDAMPSVLDFSGNNFTAHAGVAPVYQANQINSLPVFRFDGTMYWNLSNAFSALTEAEIFILVKKDNDPAVSGADWALWQLGTDDAQPDVIPYLDGVIYDGAGSTVRKTTVNPSPSLSSWTIYNVLSSSGGWTNRIGLNDLYGSANTVGFTTTPKLGAGVLAAHFLKGYVADFFIYDHALSWTVRSNLVFGYFGIKYAL